MTNLVGFSFLWDIGSTYHYCFIKCQKQEKFKAIKVKKGQDFGQPQPCQQFYFYNEFLNVIVHKSGFNFFGKCVINKASQGQVPGLAGLYGL